MPVTWLDLLLLGVMLISGLLAMIRGFMREVLSIVAWAAAAVATVVAVRDGRLVALAKGYIANDTLANVAVVAGVFLLTLLIVSMITVRISDMVLDSRIGALDRTLGFLFGLARGLVIVVVAFLFFAWLVPANKQPEGVRLAKSFKVLEYVGKGLQDLLPQDMDNYLSQWFKRRPKGEEQEPPDAPPPDAPPPAKKSDLRSPTTTASVPQPAGYPRADRTDMQQLIDTTKR